MSNKTLVHNNEIDLIYLMKIIWDKKILIISIIFISTLLGIFSNYIQKKQNTAKPTIYENSIRLYPNDKSKFLRYKKINFFLTSQDYGEYLIDKDTVFQQFLKKLEDLNLAISFLKINTHIQKKVSKLSEANANKVILDYAKSFKLIKNQNNQNYNLNFDWDNSNEGLEILNEYLEFVILNLNNEIFSNLDEIIDISKELKIHKNKIRIDYLMHQREIAKESGLKYFKDYITFSTNLKLSGDTYFLRGSNVIEKEISIIKNSEDKELYLASNEINYLKKSNNFDLIKYDFPSSNKRKNDVKQKSLIIFVIFGLIIGIISAIILNSLQQKRKTEE